MKKISIAVILLFILFIVVGCGKQTTNNEADNLNINELIQGYEVEFKTLDNYLMWKYKNESDSNWRILYNLSSLKGEQGETGQNGANGLNGNNGKSAYELACENGYTGSLTQWLESLAGASGQNGDNGKSAYELACENGYTGSLTQWLESLVGASGQNGDNGKSAYELAKENGFEGSVEEWLESLKGEQGTAGQNGQNGVSVLNAYVNDENHLILVLSNENTIDAGFVGTSSGEVSVTKFKVEFVSYDNIIVSTQYVEEGKSAYAPENPVRDGYSFDGWDELFDNISHDLVVNALWKTETNKLEAPTIVDVAYDKIYWDSVDNAETYTIRINDNYIIDDIRGSSCDIKMAVWPSKNSTLDDLGIDVARQSLKIEICADAHDGFTQSDWSLYGGTYIYVPESTQYVEKLNKYSIGYGYNLIEEDYFNQNNHENLIFNIGKLLTIGTYISDAPNTEGTSKMYSYSSMDEMMSKLSIGLDTSKEIGITGLGKIKSHLAISGGYDYRNYDYNETIIFENQRSFQDHRIQNIFNTESEALLKYCFSYDFLKAIKRESILTYGMTDEELCQFIYDHYGTHAILGITTGGIYMAVYHISTNEEHLALQLKVAYEAGFSEANDVASIGGSFGINIDAEGQWNSAQSIARFNTHTYGSTGGGVKDPNSLDSAIKSWESSLNSNTAMAVSFSNNGAISIVSLLQYIDNVYGTNVSMAYESFIEDKATEEYHQLYDIYNKESLLDRQVVLEDGKYVYEVDLTPFEGRNVNDEMAPDLLNGVLTVYPIALGKQIDKIRFIGNFGNTKKLINGFSVQLSSGWKRNVDIEFKNCGIITSESATDLVDLAKTVGIRANITYNGLNMISKDDSIRLIYNNGEKQYNYSFSTSMYDEIVLDILSINNNTLILPIATKDGYDFDCWTKTTENQEVIKVTDSKGNILVDDLEIDNLQANFKPKTFKVTLDSYGEIYVIYEEGIYYSDESNELREFEDNRVNNDLELPTRNGYNFAGYYYVKKYIGDEEFDVEPQLFIKSDGTFGSNFNAYYVNSNVYCEARWEPKTICITLMNGENVQDKVYFKYADSENNFYNDEDLTNLKTIIPPTKYLHAFKGYYKDNIKCIDNDGSILIRTSDYYADVIISAKWEENAGTTTFVLNGGSWISTEMKLYYYGQVTQLPEGGTNISKQYHRFVGWHLQSDLKDAIVTEIPANTTGNLTFYAEWIQIQHTISFDSKGGSSVNLMEKNQGDKIETLPSPTRTGYTFVGWYEIVDDTETKVESIDEILRDYNLYAKWNVNQYKLTVSFVNSNAVNLTLNITSGNHTTQCTISPRFTTEQQMSSEPMQPSYIDVEVENPWTFNVKYGDKVRIDSVNLGPYTEEIVDSQYGFTYTQKYKYAYEGIDTIISDDTTITILVEKVIIY